MSRRAILIVLLSIPLCASGLGAQQPFAVEVRGGVAFGSSVEEASLDAGEFRLWPDDIGSAPRLELKVLPPIRSSRIQPRFSASIVPGAPVEGRVLNDLSRCPTCYDDFAGEVDRFEMTVGVEVTGFRSGGSLRSYADFGLGIRSHDYYYDSFVGPGDATLEADSFSRTEVLGRFALGGGLDLGSRELILEGVIHASPVGAGVVEVEPVSTFADTEVDYGREWLFDLGLTLGLRQAF